MIECSVSTGFYVCPETPTPTGRLELCSEANKKNVFSWNNTFSGEIFAIIPDVSAARSSLHKKYCLTKYLSTVILLWSFRGGRCLSEKNASLSLRMRSFVICDRQTKRKDEDNKNEIDFSVRWPPFCLSVRHCGFFSGSIVGYEGKITDRLR